VREKRPFADGATVGFVVGVGAGVGVAAGVAAPLGEGVGVGAAEGDADAAAVGAGVGVDDPQPAITSARKPQRSPRPMALGIGLLHRFER
jgi:hypothetical protein